MPKLDREKYLVSEEFRQLVNALADIDPLGFAMFAVAGLCGLRIIEVVSIRFADLLLNETPEILKVGREEETATAQVTHGRHRDPQDRRDRSQALHRDPAAREAQAVDARVPIHDAPRLPAVQGRMRQGGPVRLLLAALSAAFPGHAGIRVNEGCVLHHGEPAAVEHQQHAGIHSHG